MPKSRRTRSRRRAPDTGPSCSDCTNPDPHIPCPRHPPPVIDPEIVGIRRRWLEKEEGEGLNAILGNQGPRQRRAVRLFRLNPNTESRAVVLSPPRSVRGAKGRTEYEPCLHALDYQTGELRCDSIGKEAPYQDCRNWYCPHAAEMRERVEKRLHWNALGVRRRGGL